MLQGLGRGEMSPYESIRVIFYKKREIVSIILCNSIFSVLNWRLGMGIN